MPAAVKSVRHHKRKIPVKKRNLVICGLAILTLLLGVFIATGKLSIGGEYGIRWVGGIMWLVMIGNIVLLVIGIKDFPDNQFRTFFRVMAIVLPLASLVFYVLVYLIGLIAG